MLSVVLLRRHVIAAKVGSMAICLWCGGVVWGHIEATLSADSDLKTLGYHGRAVGSIPAHTK